jgi:O-antigen/teichoic acid export membrane protein
VTSYRQQVVHSFLWQGTAQAAGQAISWLATIVVIRLLSPGDYGLMAMANVFLGFFILFSDLGFGAAAIQAEVLEHEQLQRMLGIVLVVNVGGCLLTLGAAPLLGAFFGEPRLAPVVRVMSLSFLLNAAYVVPQSMVLREMDFRRRARIDILAMVLGALTALSLAAAGLGVWALVASALMTQAVKAVAYNVSRPVAVMPVFSWGAAGGLARFGALITIDRLLFYLYSQADVVIGGRVLGKEAIGLYSVALSLAATPMDKVLPVITQVSFVAFSRIQSDPERVRRNLLRAVQIISLVSFPAFLGMAAVAGDLIPIVLGSRWVDLIVPFQLLCLVLPLKAVASLFPPALFGVGRPAVNVANMAISLATMTAAILVGVQHGVVGMCFAWVIAYPAVFGVTSWRSLHALGARVTAFLGRCAFPAVASVTMGAAVLAARVALGPLAVSALRLGVLVGTGVVLYAGFVYAFQRGAVRDLLAVVRRD